MVVRSFKFFLLTLSVCICDAWDLSYIGIEEYSLLHVSLYRSRAYLSIEVLNPYKNGSTYSLVETSWPETEVYAKGRPFPSGDWHLHGNCDTLQKVISTDVDFFGRIWILDKGNAEFNCSEKLVVYSLFSNQIIHVFKFGSDRLNVATVKIDPAPLQRSHKAFVGVSNENVMYICCTHTEKCTRVVLSHDKNKNPSMNKLISTENIAISKSQNKLFVTSPNSPSVFAITLDNIRKNELENKHNGPLKMAAKYLGDKLGPSHGLLVDSGHSLFYYLTRDYAIVRWDTRKPLRAESHDVLAQSYQLLPNVTDLISDSHGSVWAVNNAIALSKESYSKANKMKNKKNVFKKEQITPSCIKVSNHDYFMF